MKFLILLLAAFSLSGCALLDEVLRTDDELPASIPVGAYENTADFQEIERLLTRVELEAGLGNLDEASSLLRELLTKIEDGVNSQSQRARMNTMKNLLADTMAMDESVSGDFTGNDAAAIIENLYGREPGFTYVYHAFPSFVGSSEIGFYVFKVPVDEDESSSVAEFFVTSSGDVQRID